MHLLKTSSVLILSKAAQTADKKMQKELELTPTLGLHTTSYTCSMRIVKAEI